MASNKRYLGDGCYAEITEQGLVLTTENGIRVTNRVVMEPEVFAALIKFFPLLLEWKR